MPAFTETDEQESRKIALYWCGRKGIIPDDDMFQVAAIALWRLMSDPHKPQTRTARFNAVKWAITQDLRKRVQGKEFVVRSHQDGEAIRFQFAAPANADTSEEREFLDIAEKVLASLERKVIVRLRQNRTINQIACELGITPHCAWVHRYHAIRKMRECLGTEDVA